MDQGLLPRRYAKALYKYTTEHNAATSMYAIMGTLVDAYSADASLQATIANPFVETTRKQSILNTAAAIHDKETADAFDDFVKLLAKHRRMDIMRDIALAFRSIYRQANNIYRVHITSATPLNDADQKRIHAMIQKHIAQGTAEYTYSTDADLIGGFTVTIDSQRLDASVRNELQQLRQRLIM